MKTATALLLVTALVGGGALLWTTYGGLLSAEGSSLTGPSKERMQAFTQWVQAAGGTLSHVEPFLSPLGGIGLRATRNIEVGDTIMRIPQRLAMNSATARASAIGELIQSTDWPASRLSFGVHLLYERFYLQEQSAFWPYLALMPLDISWHPTQWPQAAVDRAKRSSYLSFSIEALRGSWDTWCKYLTELRTSNAAWQAALATTSSGMAVSNDSLCSHLAWAIAMMDSRVYGQRDDEDPEEYSLLPVMDLANHKRLAYAPRRMVDDAGKSSYYHTANAAQRAGTEVFASYGDYKCNQPMLLNYGFVLTSDDASCVETGITIASWTHPLPTLLAPYAEKLSKAFIRFGGALQKEVLVALRLLALQQRDGNSAFLIKRGLYGIVDQQSECGASQLILQHLGSLNLTEWPRHEQTGRPLTMAAIRSRVLSLPRSSLDFSIEWTLYSRLRAIEHAYNAVIERWQRLTSVNRPAGDWTCALPRAVLPETEGSDDGNDDHQDGKQEL